jgi:cytochrome c2
LAFLSEIPYPYPFELKKEVQPEDIDDGEKLYHEIFACAGCHSVNGRGGQVGPDHSDVASRLTRKWIEQWLKDPQSIQSDVRMPKFKFKDWEYEALTDYLLTLGKYRFVQVKRINLFQKAVLL